MADLKGLQKRLGVDFKDEKLLTQALVHRSYLNEHRSFPLPHNERLEFLGDAVLELIVTDYLFRNYDQPEGDLTSWRSALVRGEMLGALAQELGLGDALLMSRGEAKSGGRTRQMLLANVFESVVGALYLDQGYEAANTFVNRTVLPHLPEIIDKKLDRDAKSRLQEVAQERHNVTPKYRVVEATGPDHAKKFTISVTVADKEMGVGAGNSKQQAEQAAAEAALRELEGAG